MNLRDLKPKTLKALAQQGEDECKDWLDRTQGRQFGTIEPIKPDDIYRLAFSKGATAILSRITNGQFSEEV